MGWDRARGSKIQPSYMTTVYVHFHDPVVRRQAPHVAQKSREDHRGRVDFIELTLIKKPLLERRVKNVNLGQHVRSFALFGRDKVAIGRDPKKTQLRSPLAGVCVCKGCSKSLQAVHSNKRPRVSRGL